MLVSCAVLRAMDPIFLLGSQPTGRLCLLCSMLVWLKGIGQTLLPHSGLRQLSKPKLNQQLNSTEFEVIVKTQTQPTAQFNRV